MKHWPGPLTAWDQECRLLFQYYGRLEDSFSVRILDAAACATSSITTRLSSRSGRFVTVALSPPCFVPAGQPWPTRVTTSAGERVTWPNMLQQWHFLGEGVLLKKAVCLWVPDPIMSLIRRGEWKYLVLARRWLGFEEQQWLWKQAWLPRPSLQWLQAVEHAGIMCNAFEECLSWPSGVVLLE